MILSRGRGASSADPGSGSPGNPGGNNGQIQYNDAGAFGGVTSAFSVDPGTGRVVIDVGSGISPIDILAADLGPFPALGITSDGEINLNGRISAPYFSSTLAGRTRISTDNDDVIEVTATGAVDKLGFFAGSPVAQQAEPTTMNEVVALLQAYGLSA